MQCGWCAAASGASTSALHGQLHSGAIHIGDKMEATISRITDVVELHLSHRPRRRTPRLRQRHAGWGQLSHDVVHRDLAQQQLRQCGDDQGRRGQRYDAGARWPGRCAAEPHHRQPSQGRQQEQRGGATNGIAVYDFSDNARQVTIADTVISNNRSIAVGKHGSAVVYGGGIVNNRLLELNRVTVRGNTADAQSPSAIAQGGGSGTAYCCPGRPYG